MSANQKPFDSRNHRFAATVAKVSAAAVLILGSTFAPAAMAAGNSAEVNARYHAERAACNSGEANQDRAACLREAGAARAESNRGRLNNGQNSYQKNALARCDAQPQEDRAACVLRVEGSGTTSGSVGAGGVMQELIEIDIK